ncbi:MAG: proline--tRNA ligase [Chloroflexi bacterium HGW-Chloroflexi-8]|nr:MAG: proline--tRNA ligase [Chloroflexi bacterium HGW-Chloroflexi-8]
MRMSQFFNQTLRETPSEAQTPGTQYLIRAGYIRQVAAGIFTLMPLGKRVISRIENILRQEMNQIGGQELSMPVTLPADLWKESGRWYAVGPELGRFKDRNQRDMVLAMTHEEAVGDLVRKEIRSYKQLPRLIYHIQTKFRDDPRPRAGLIRVREFTMKDSYSLDRDWDGLAQQYKAHYQAYFNIFRRCGLETIAVKSDTGMMGGKLAHEFMFLNSFGEDTLMLCRQCGFSANRQVATFQKPVPEKEEALPLKPVHTPATKTIEDLSRFLNIPTSKTAKAVFMTATFAEDEKETQQVVMAIVRGDMDLNETKLTNAIKAKDLRPATEEEIQSIGAVAGFASPIGLQKGLIVVDDLIPLSANLVAGANKSDYHYINVNYNRDFKASIVTDLVSARDGDACPNCGQPLYSERGIEVGNIFQLGTRYSDAMGCTFQDENGELKPVIMGSYGIGVGRLFGCVAEQYHDDYGLILPASIAPFHVHLIVLPSKNSEEPLKVAEKLYQDLMRARIDVLYDERTESAGIKFNDADLIGIPLRITVAEKALKEGAVEFKLRREKEKILVPVQDAIPRTMELLLQLDREIAQKVKAEEYLE